MKKVAGHKTPKDKQNDFGDKISGSQAGGRASIGEERNDGGDDKDNEKYVRRYLEGLMDAQLNSALGALPQEQKDRIRELEALATGSAWSAARDRFMELLLGHVESVEFSRLIDFLSLG